MNGAVAYTSLEAYTPHQYTPYNNIHIILPFTSIQLLFRLLPLVSHPHFLGLSDPSDTLQLNKPYKGRSSERLQERGTEDTAVLRSDLINHYTLKHILLLLQISTNHTPLSNHNISYPLWPPLSHRSFQSPEPPLRRLPSPKTRPLNKFYFGLASSTQHSAIIS